MRLIDSDVIVWYWRSQKAAASLLAAGYKALSRVGLDRLDVAQSANPSP